MESAISSGEFDANAIEIRFDGFRTAISNDSTLFYLISSHGEYNLVETLNPQTPNPYSFVVPENTYVIETLDIGRYCSTTIDKPLWNLLQPANRKKLVSLLTNKEHLKPTSGELSGIYNFTNTAISAEDYINALKNFIVYLPDMRVPLRTLRFGNDVRFIPNPEKPTEKILDYKLSYRGFGVYKFPVEGAADAKPIAAPFPKARDALQITKEDFN
jgi:hypothetical protein